MRFYMSGSQSITLRVAAKDVELARKLAEEKGLPYQTLIKMLLHQALNREQDAFSRGVREASSEEASGRT